MADENIDNPINIIEEHDLELTLGLRPLNPKNVALQIITPNNNNIDDNNNNILLSKREQQAIRRHEAKVKREFKRKAPASLSNNGGAGFRPFNKGHFGHFNHAINSINNDAANLSSASSTTSSAISTAGGHSSDTSSHSSHPQAHLTAANTPTPSSMLKQPTSSQEETPNCSNTSLLQPKLYSSSSNQVQVFPNSRPPSNSPDFVRTQLKEAKEVIGKPLKPNGLTTSQESDPLSQMPCVTTTGNGPKGKTITGFLYKYTKIDVTIVCVCHGVSFSPAGFVEHAGGVDIEHPLKHIRVGPFPLK